jgi:hypothetical protein
MFGHVLVKATQLQEQLTVAQTRRTVSEDDTKVLTSVWLREEHAAV